MSIFSRVIGATAIAALSTAALPGPAEAAVVHIEFTGTDGIGGLLTGSADVDQEGANVPLLAFTATFTNLTVGGAPVDTLTFGLGDVTGGYWFTASNPDGLGSNTFSFDLNGTGPNQSIVTGAYCYYYCISLFDNANTYFDYFSTVVTSPAQSAVPEPASWAMMGGGLAMIGGAMRRRRRQAEAGIA